MIDPLRIFFFSVLSVECLLGTALNAFIVLTHCLEWKKTKHLPSSDKIETCLCLSRFFLQWAITMHNFFRTFLPLLYFQLYFNEVFLVVRMFLSFTGLWIATLLSVFYCVKITSYNLSVFVFLKTRISRMVPWLILSCPLVSLASSLPFGWCVYTLYYANSTVQNSTRTNIAVAVNIPNQSLIYTVGSSVPFALFSFTVLPLIHTLWSHTKQMKSSGVSFRSPNLDTLLSVVKSLIIFFFLCIIYFVNMNLTLSGLLPIGSPWMVLVSILTSAYPFLHSAVLISTNSKLKQAYVNLLSTIVPKRF